MNEYAFEINWRNILIPRLKAVLKKLDASVKEEQRVATARKAEINTLSPEEAHEAFGWDVITEDEYRAVVEQTERAEAPTVMSAARDELKEYIARLTRQVRDFEWMSKPESEREEIRIKNERFRAEIKREKAAT